MQELRIVKIIQKQENYIVTLQKKAILWQMSKVKALCKITYFSRAGLFSMCPLIAFLIIVFLPIKTTKQRKQSL